MSITEMRNDAQSDDGREAWPSRLPDVSDLSLIDLRASANPILVRTIERLAESLRDPGTASAGFQSAL